MSDHVYYNFATVICAGVTEYYWIESMTLFNSETKLILIDFPTTLYPRFKMIANRIKRTPVMYTPYTQYE